ncbi:RNA methyltransferase [Helcobacillus massiliensis]|uniref:TrmH family RNA methyltransferase n=1 Tax=Helcobacillus massiliensis TaxID=521392 RepID=UPI0021A5841C|nr:RNA methyltransferase [Helcobacillus massiliensis]MCT1557806.1 RNA methyltransferase [Helcobacillus massiliensis]MCT2036698.1 RNA methyltransferase [Helcobacillus massiliensis]MCT2332169.1 RNA methyltransferase [Helcobacillus massiliensis]
MTSTRSDRVRLVASLSGRSARSKHGQFRVEGPQAVRSLLEARGDWATALFLTDDARTDHPDLVRLAAEIGLPITPVTAEVITGMVRDQGQQSVVSPQGVIATARIVETPWLELLERAAGSGGEADGAPVTIVAADRLQDPGNAGTLLRTADASGAAAVFFGDGSVDPYAPKTVRSTAGSLFHVPFARRVPLADLLTECTRRRITTAATSGYAHTSLFSTDLPGRIAWLMGNEARGLGEDLLQRADLSIAIPLSGRAESLNLAAAAALCLFESARRR